MTPGGRAIHSLSSPMTTSRDSRVYVEEAVAFDANMVSQARDGLDVTVVFVCVKGRR